ncbi:hypothetical protein AAF712_000375 [Marasmius tenuissimus]|uniref:Uncharacterized protein n=1 Tax=Marasmius tenuissimus TaxID=585030 RepID=A0ABR3AJ65_9AGAR
MGFFRPKPAPPAYGEGKEIPERKALYVRTPSSTRILLIDPPVLPSFLSQIWFAWLDPLLRVGYTRPLEQEDLWNLPSDRLTTVLTDRVESAFFDRCAPEKRPLAFRETSRDSDSERDDKIKEGEPREEGGTSYEGVDKEKVYDASILKTLHGVFYAQWWFAGLLQLGSGMCLSDRIAMNEIKLVFPDALKITTPLVNKILLNWLAESYLFYRTTEAERSALGISMTEPRGVGFGIGIAFAIFSMQGLHILL